jgi:Zn finger protein HypA/HybF involved in hydrogenase expression
MGCFIKVSIVCTEHGIFQQRPDSHLQGNGCPKCGSIKKGESRNKGLKYFIEQAKLVHGDKYDYSDTVYLGMRKKLFIRCPHHGIFEQCSYNHLIGQGCPECKRLRISDLGRKDVSTFIKDSIIIHGNKYDYSQVNYKSARIKVCILCPKHGKFYQTPTSHLHGSGCPRCGSPVSKWEIELLGFIKSMYPDTIGSYRGWCPGHPRKEIDIFIPSLNVGFECNGIYWHKIVNNMDGGDKVVDAINVGIILYVLWDNISIEQNKRLICYHLNKEYIDGSK